jgi:thiol-disulfide isomerase/thioredoxin
MRSSRLASFLLLAAVIAFAQTFVFSSLVESRQRSKAKSGTVWLVFFLASDCERCEHVKTFIDALKAKYPVRIKAFDVDRRPNYELMERLQAIHSKQEFAVPLVMVGETILMGEKEISAKLENTVRKLARSGGARVPYLGQASDRTSTRTSDSECRKCNEHRPPEIREELKRIRSLLGRWL